MYYRVKCVDEDDHLPVNEYIELFALIKREMSDDVKINMAGSDGTRTIISATEVSS
jgi:hypothetical protein